MAEKRRRRLQPASAPWRRPGDMKQVYCKDFWDYTVHRDSRTGRFYILVICNPPGAMFEVYVRLTPRDVARFRRNPGSLIGLAHRIMSEQPGTLRRRRR
ncbi:MAG: hypothetical protein K8T20_02715 [Planctomycetes bacterium]|nr:hypothetical protein [Planctomycetota bacterium]